jgi:hypothetical protein
MNEKLWNMLNKFRGTQLHGLEGLAEFVRREGVEFSPDDLSSWGQLLTTQFGRHAGIISAPEWLITVFGKFIEGVSAKTICDPWAGVGQLIGALRGAQPEESFAFTRNQSEYFLGKALVPEANWQLGHALDLLGATNKQFDVVASILPIGARSAHPLNISTPSGNLELRDEFGNLLMVAASMRLDPSGVGLFVVTPSFFSSPRSVFRHLETLGLGIEAALALPSGTFAPFTNIPAYLVVVRRKLVTRMFVAQLSSDANTNLQVVDNFRHSTEGGTLELGRFVDANSFISLGAIRTAERFALAERRFGAPSVKLGELSTAINLGRFGEAFAFPNEDNAVFVPLIGKSDVVDSVDDLTLKKQNYAQVVVNQARSNARFIARFLNSEFGKELREQSSSGAVIPKLNKQTLSELRVFVPDFPTQRMMLEIEGRIVAEQNTLLGLQSELGDFRRELWANPGAAEGVNQRLTGFSRQLAGGIKEHTVRSFDQWLETLPFPMASILRAWQATPSQDFRTKHEHLLHFFEGTAEFLSVILLSAFSSNEALFGLHKQKVKEAMQNQNLSFQRATFGTWKLVVEYFGKQTRELLLEAGKTPDDAKNDRSLCADIFSDPSLALPEALSRKDLARILSTTNKMRNDWSGHGGVVGQEEAQLRNEQIIGEVHKLRDVIAETWAETQLVRALHCLPRRGVFENEVAILMGSNSEFVKETRPMATWLDVERLYLSNKGSGSALKLLPLVQVGPSPQSAKNACYFFNRVERDGARFISYHFTDKPELRGQFDEATETIKFLTEV